VLAVVAQSFSASTAGDVPFFDIIAFRTLLGVVVDLGIGLFRVEFF